MVLTVTPFYAAALTVLYIALTLRVIRFRRDNRVALGDAGDPDLIQLIRAHANFAEYAPFGLVLLLIAELAGTPALLLHLTGALLVAGRAVHAWHLWMRPRQFGLRVIAMSCTFAALVLGAALAVLATL